MLKNFISLADQTKTITLMFTYPRNSFPMVPGYFPSPNLKCRKWYNYPCFNFTLSNTLHPVIYTRINETRIPEYLQKSDSGGIDIHSTGSSSKRILTLKCQKYQFPPFHSFQSFFQPFFLIASMQRNIHYSDRHQKL